MILAHGAWPSKGSAGATVAPFLNDELDSALDELTGDPDERLAYQAQTVAAQHREARRRTADELLNDLPYAPSRLLARRFGCGSEAVTRAMEDPAKRASLLNPVELDIELRAERCAR